MMLRLLRASERQAVPWKNGAGKTREVISYPAGSSVKDFVWRVSMAEVSVSSAFSLFAGIKRILAVISGCLRLTFPDGRVITLQASDPAYPFSGDLPVGGTPLGGPVLDLNVMVNEKTCAASVERLEAGDHEIVGGVDCTTIIVATGQAAVETDRRKVELGHLDALLIDDAKDVEDSGGAYIRLASASPSFMIRIYEAGNGYVSAKHCGWYP